VTTGADDTLSSSSSSAESAGSRTLSQVLSLQNRRYDDMFLQQAQNDNSRQQHIREINDSYMSQIRQQQHQLQQEELSSASAAAASSSGATSRSSSGSGGGGGSGSIGDADDAGDGMSGRHRVERSKIRNEALMRQMREIAEKDQIVTQTTRDSIVQNNDSTINML